MRRVEEYAEHFAEVVEAIIISYPKRESRL